MRQRAKSRNLFGFLTKKTVTYQRSRGQASPSIRAYRAGVQSGDTGGFDSWLAKQPGVRDAGRSTVDRLEKQYRRGVERAGAAERVKEARAARKPEKGGVARSSGTYKGVRIIPTSGGFKLSAIDRESIFDTAQDAKDFIKDAKKNPCAVTRKASVTDRAKRYRANQPGCKPAGAKKCKLCARSRDLMVDHKDGDESNGRKSNLRWLCRSCNTLRGAEMARTGQGRRTVQYNPGGAQTLGEYMEAILQHTRGAHDAGGKIIHETPKSRRREFASQIWAARKGRAGAGDYYTESNPGDEFTEPGPAAFSVALFDGVGKMGDNVPITAPTLQAAQEKAQSYADEMGRDAVLYDDAGVSLGRFPTTGQFAAAPNPARRFDSVFAAQAWAVRQRRTEPFYADINGWPGRVLMQPDAFGKWKATPGTPRSNPDADLYERIQAHLQGGGVVAVRTALKHTNYLPKHAAMFRRPTNAAETGVYVQRGKHWDYVFPQYVHFGRFKTNGKARGRNPEQTEPGDADQEYQQALKIAELFHGRAVKEEITVTEMIREHDWLWRIGPLVSLTIKPLTGGTFDIPFHEDADKMVHLFCSPDGRQFYLRGGDQELDLDAIEMGERSDWFRDLMLIGEAKEITYQDKKKFHRFKLIDYYHKLGEVTKKKPMLAYDSLAKRLTIVGGQYRVETEELVDGMSPGIVN